jgi:hypothetical protein
MSEPFVNEVTNRFCPELKFQLDFIQQYAPVLAASAGSNPSANPMLKDFKDYLALGSNSDRLKNSKINIALLSVSDQLLQHCIITDNGALTNFFETQLAKYQGNHQLISDVFLLEFCELHLVPNMDIHFLQTDNLKPSIEFWQEYICECHPNMSREITNSTECKLWHYEPALYQNSPLQSITPDTYFRLCKPQPTFV